MIRARVRMRVRVCAGVNVCMCVSEAGREATEVGFADPLLHGNAKGRVVVVVDHGLQAERLDRADVAVCGHR